jgi:hypothetical protein
MSVYGDGDMSSRLRRSAQGFNVNIRTSLTWFTSSSMILHSLKRVSKYSLLSSVPLQNFCCVYDDLRIVSVHAIITSPDPQDYLHRSPFNVKAYLFTHPTMPLCQSNTLNLDRHALGKLIHRHTAACRLVREELLVGGVHLGEVVHAC